jgi:NitT/TauT family transport system substrate-binding protein
VGRARRIGARIALAVVLGGVLTSLTGCTGAAAGEGSGTVSLRLGYLPNLTHATAIVGLQQGLFAQSLGSGVRLSSRTFNAGGDAVQALFTGAIDAAYLGPSPTINAFAQSHGQAIRVVAGAASGGVSLVVKPSISGPSGLVGARIATPQLGNTQDVALRYWLLQQGLHAMPDGGGDVHVVPQDNASTVTAFASGAIDGAWVPEPYASRLVAAGGHVLVDERSLWPGGQFAVTNLVVTSSFLAGHPDVVKDLVAGSVAANAFINAQPDQARQVVAEALSHLSGRQQSAAALTPSWQTLTFTDDPLADTLRADAQHARAVGLLGAIDLRGLYDLTALNQLRQAASEAPVTS